MFHNRTTREQKEAANEKILGPNVYIKTASQEQGFLYMCGAAIGRYLRQNGDCSSCENLLCSEAPLNSFIEMRKYDPSSDLKYPSAASIKFFRITDNALHRHMMCNIQKENVMMNLYNTLKYEIPCKLPSCDEHYYLCEEFILKKWIQMSIKIFCKDFLQKKNERKIARKRKKLSKSYIPMKRERLC